MSNKEIHHYAKCAAIYVGCGLAGAFYVNGVDGIIIVLKVLLLMIPAGLMMEGTLYVVSWTYRRMMAICGTLLSNEKENYHG